MASFVALSVLVLGFVSYAAWEFGRHQRFVRSIPHRIHINGSRGKSSVTRLVGAALRAGGIRTVTKVTGTFPRLILPSGDDVPVHRRAGASILEQLDIIELASREEIQALVIECMALEPEYQRITEEQMVHATMTVMTNVRLDHTDVMGRTIDKIAASMANTIPRGGRVLSSDPPHRGLLQSLARERGAEHVHVGADDVTREDMAGFSYIEHRANVALALEVSGELGVARETALEGMWSAVPDAGVLTKSTVSEGDVTTTFFNGFAANDRDSTELLWRMLADDGHLVGERFVLLNSRPDRKDRSEQLAHLIATSFDADHIFVMGAPTDAVVRRLAAYGQSRDVVSDLGNASAEVVYQAIIDRTAGESSTLAVGNMGGAGAETVALFEARKDR